MKLRILALILTLGLCGCGSVIKGLNQVELVAQAFTELLPSDFEGDIDLSRKDQYFTITLIAVDVKKNEQGAWTWRSVEYKRNTHLPITGFAWQSEVHFKLGKSR